MELKLDKRKIILIAVAAVALIAILILLLLDGSKKTKYYEEEYAVTVKATKTGGLKITLDGKKNSDVPWEYIETYPDKTEEASEETAENAEENSEAENTEENAVEVNPVVTYTSKANSSSVTFYVKPNRMGYDTIVATKNRTVGDVAFPVAKVYIDLVVSEEEGGLKTQIAAVTEDCFEGAHGASETETPYYITGNYIYLPNAGDWKLTNTDMEESDPTIVLGVADNGSYYYRVDQLKENEEKNLRLYSETLKTEIFLRAYTGADGRIKIEEAR